MLQTLPRTTLTPEETYLWECARNWRAPLHQKDAAALDWERIITVGRHNRMQTLLDDVFRATGALDQVPPAARETLKQDVALITEAATRQSEGLRQYLHQAAKLPIETVVYKGLSLSINVYGNPAMRPGGDIDILVRANQVQDSIAVLESLGLGRYWPDLLDDRYYERHHLHQQRSTPDYKVWFEIHWALDHPYTLLTIDYHALMDRTTPGQLLGEPVNDLSLPDLLLTAAVHLVKHAVYLPSVLQRPELARIILADGMLMYFMDVAEVVKRCSRDLDWSLTVDLARQWGAVDILGSVLRVCHEFLAAPVPEWVLEALPVADSGFVTRRTMNRVADYELATYRGEKPSRFWNLLLSPEGAFIMRPIRLLDLAAYCFPGGDFMRRRYGESSWLTALKHLLQALGHYVRIGIDGPYYAWKRYRRLRKKNRLSSPHPLEAQT